MTLLWMLLSFLFILNHADEEIKVERVKDNGKKIPIPKNGPQFDPNKLAEPKPLLEKEPYGKKKGLDQMVLRIPNSKDLLLTYFGKWSLRALVESKEFALVIPYATSRRIGYVRYECKKGDKEIHRVSQYRGMMLKTFVEINGDRVDGIHVLMGCEAGQIENAILWGTYDSFLLHSLVIESASSPTTPNRIESAQKEGERYGRTKKQLIKRYGKKGSGFWDWGAKEKLFGRAQIEEFHDQKQQKSEL